MANFLNKLKPYNSLITHVLLAVNSAAVIYLLHFKGVTL